MMMVSLLLCITLAAAIEVQHKPEQVHVSWAEEHDSMYVTWALSGKSPGQQRLWYGKGAGDMQSVPATYTPFPNDATTAGSRTLHYYWAKATGLDTPGTLYQYYVGSSSHYSDWYTFQSKRNFTNPELPPTVIIYGDLGVGPEITDTVNMLENEFRQNQIDAILHVGDFAYNLDSDNGTLGDKFFEVLEPIASKWPYMATMGNHESDPYIIAHYQYRMHMPGTSTNFWYSFDVGPVHFVAFSTEWLFYNVTDYGQYQTYQLQQMAFLEEDLAAVDRSETPWVVTLSHRPMYCSANWWQEPEDHCHQCVEEEEPHERHNRDCTDSAPLVQDAYEELFYKHEVDISFFGHVHAYERMAPAYRNETVISEYDSTHTTKGAKAPVQIITGVPGQQESYAPVSPTPLPFSVLQTDEKSFGKLTAYNATHLYWEQISSIDDSILDYYWLIK